MKNLFFVLLAALVCLPFTQAADDPLPPPNLPGYVPPKKKAPAENEDKPWFRNAGEYLASRSVRMGVPTEPDTKLITDGKRFDVSMGKRISLHHWGQQSPSETWAFGIDGGMLASLTRYQKNGQLTFATNTFDGFFGAYIGHISNGWLTMLRYGHLSAHLVDSSPDILSPNLYSQFWTEVIVGKTFPEPAEESNWEVHLQGSAGFNNTSAPKAKQPRASLGTTVSYSPGGPDRLAIIASADALRAGVFGQKNSYSFFTGIGSINRPNSTDRPYRLGIGHFIGSDYRNQYYARKQKWTTFQVSAEF